MKRVCGIGFLFLVFFTSILVLPEYFALEISNSLPLLTATRLLMLLLIFLNIPSKGFTLRSPYWGSISIKKGITIYIVSCVLVDLFYLSSASGEAIKDLFVVIFEQWLFTWAILLYINTKERLVSALKLMAYTSGVVVVFAIIESFTGNNVFYLLKTTQRDMMMTEYLRLGLIRASASFGHPVYYAVYSIIMLFVTTYFYSISKTTKSKIFNLMIIFLNMFAILMCNTRGAFAAFAGILMYFLFTELKHSFYKYFKWIVLGSITLLMIYCFFPETSGKWLNNWAKSIISIADSSYSVEDYGRNAAGLESRTAQLSGITWTIKNNAIIGLGPNPLKRGAVRYWVNGRWKQAVSIDVGYVNIFMYGGIIGFIGAIIFYGILISSVFKKQKSISKDTENYRLLKMFKTIFIVYAFLLLTSVGVNIVLWMMIALYISFLNILKKEQYSIHNSCLKLAIA